MNKIMTASVLLASMIATAPTTAGGNDEDANQSGSSSTTQVVSTTSGSVAPASSGGNGTNTTTTTTTTTTTVNGGSTNTGASDGAFGATEGEAIFIDLSLLTDPDRIGNTRLQWEMQDQSQASPTWQRISGATASVFIPTQKHVGKNLRVQLTYMDGKGNVESITSPATDPVLNVNDPPTGMPSVLGKPVEGHSLGIDMTGVYDEDGITHASVQWQGSIDGLVWDNIETTDTALFLDQALVGLYVRAVISYRDGYGNGEVVTSPVVGTVENVNDNITGSPKITGEAIEGAVLFADSNDINDIDGIFHRYTRWQSTIDGNWHTIPGATSDRLRLPNYLAGAKVRAVVSVVDKFGVEESAHSVPVGPIEAINTRPTGVLMFKNASN